MGGVLTALVAFAKAASVSDGAPPDGRTAQQHAPALPHTRAQLHPAPAHTVNPHRCGCAARPGTASSAGPTLSQCTLLCCTGGHRSAPGAAQAWYAQSACAGTCTAGGPTPAGRQGQSHCRLCPCAPVKILLGGAACSGDAVEQHCVPSLPGKLLGQQAAAPSHAPTGTTGTPPAQQLIHQSRVAIVADLDGAVRRAREQQAPRSHGQAQHCLGVPRQPVLLP